MKIYLYLRHFPAKGNDINDGLKKAIHGLACGLTNCGAEVTVLSEASQSGDSSFQTTDGYRIECFEQPIQSRPSFTLSSGLKQYVRDAIEQESLLVLNGIFHPSIYSLSRLLKKAKLPYVIAPHDVYHPAMFRKNAHLKWTFWHLLEKRILRQAKAIQVLDIRQARWLHQLGIRTPIIEVTNGFSSTDVHSERNLDWQVDKPIKLFFFGRIDTPHKGLDLLLEAFASITKQTSVQLTIQGPDGGYKKQLQARADKLLLEERVKFLEPDYTQSPSQIISNYDVFCLPSRFEGFGLSALEAMLAGRVLLVSEEAGIAPHVQASGCGITVSPEVSSIEGGLLKLLNCRAGWKDMGLSGRHYVLQHLDWDKIAASALEHYRHLIS